MRNRCIAAGLALLFLLFSGCTVKVKQSENQPDTSDYLQVVTLTLAGAGLHQPDSMLSDERMLDIFEKSSGIRVSVIRSAHLSSQDDYFDYLSLLERSASLPDLLIFPSIPEIEEKHILTDLKKFVQDDSEYQSIPEPLRKAASFSGGLPAVPLRYYLEGYFINKAIFETEKIAAPSYGFGFTRFFSSIKALAAKKGTHLALGQFYEIPFWYPVIQKTDPSLWGAYVDGNFSMDGKHFKDGVSYASQLRAACYPDTEADALPKETDESLLKKWKAGSLALYYGSTADIEEIKNVGFSVSFAGIPGEAPLVDADYIGITTGCTRPREAFSLLKWLSYGQDGLQERYASEDSLLTGNPPLNADMRLTKQFIDEAELEGLQEAVESVSKAIVRGEDYIPGYHTYMKRLQYSLSCLPGVEQSAEQWIFDAVDGKYSFLRYASELNKLVNWRPKE